MQRIEEQSQHLKSRMPFLRQTFIMEICLNVSRNIVTKDQTMLRSDTKMNNEARIMAHNLEKLLRLKTKPITIKMIRNEEQIPEYAVRPVKNIGRRLALCQSFAQARRQGQTLAMLKEDNWCFEPVIGLGFAPPPEEFLDGENRYPGTAKTKAAGSRWAKQMPRLRTNKYIGIVISPLEKTVMNPDLIIIYCDPSQLTQILIAVNWIDGRDVSSILSGHAGCVYAIVPAIQNRDFSITIPCMGDRARAAAQEYELIFSLPWERAQDLLDGLKTIEANKPLFPIDYNLRLEYQLEKSYQKLGKKVGLHIE